MKKTRLFAKFVCQVGEVPFSDKIVRLDTRYEIENEVNKIKQKEERGIHEKKANTKGKFYERCFCPNAITNIS